MAAVAAFCNVGTTVMGSFDAGVIAKVQHCFQAFISPQELRLGIKNYFVFLTTGVVAVATLFLLPFRSVSCQANRGERRIHL